MAHLIRITASLTQRPVTSTTLFIFAFILSTEQTNFFSPKYLFTQNPLNNAKSNFQKILSSSNINVVYIPSKFSASNLTEPDAQVAY